MAAARVVQWSVGQAVQAHIHSLTASDLFKNHFVPRKSLKTFLQDMFFLQYQATKVCI